MNVLAVGDCGIDRYVDARYDRPGGISLNFAANALSCFDAADRIGVLTVLGDDRESALVQAAIEAFGLGGRVVRRAGATSVQYIDHDAAGERLFVRYEAGALADYRLTAADRALIADADVLIATVFTQILGLFDEVAASPSRGLRALDYCNLGSKDDPLAYVRRYANRFDIGFLGLDARDPAMIDALEIIARQHGKLFVVTLGADGSIALGGARRIACPAVPVAKVVDTTGAGDSFAAGFLGSYARGGDAPSALEAGARAAARTLGHMGAFPATPVPWPADAPAAWSPEKW